MNPNAEFSSSDDSYNKIDMCVFFWNTESISQLRVRVNWNNSIVKEHESTDKKREACFPEIVLFVVIDWSILTKCRKMLDYFFLRCYEIGFLVRSRLHF